MCRLDGSTVGCLDGAWLVVRCVLSGQKHPFEGKKQVPEREFLDEFFSTKYL
jgi:hypothetical protein